MGLCSQGCLSLRCTQNQDEYSVQVFFYTGKSLEALRYCIYNSAARYKLQKDLQKVLNNYNIDPGSKKVNAIESLIAAESRTQTTPPPPHTRAITGDATTWCRAGVKRRRETSREPPMELDEDLTQHRRRGLELLPVSTLSRRPNTANR